MTSAPPPPAGTGSGAITCAPRLELQALPGLPLVGPGDDLAALVQQALARAAITLRDGDVLAVASKIVSRAEGRFVDVQTVVPTAQAKTLGAQIGKDPRLVELILRESVAISRAAPGVLVTRHRLGFVGANASIDLSNAVPSAVGVAAVASGTGPWALLLPEAPDASAERLRRALGDATGAQIGVVITDSLGRPFRLGTVGAAVGVAGLPPLWDRRGEVDLFGRVLEQTITALADQVAAAADLVAGQAAEGRAVVHVRGLSFPAAAPGEHETRALLRPPEQDLYK